ncbi:hypothetical protein Tco_1353974 [Tanacetum coccineum]
MYSPGNIKEEINIDDLTVEQYFKLTQENHAPSVGLKVDYMTIAEYLEYEETIKTQDYDGYQTHSTKAGVSTRQRDHLNSRHKSPNLPLEAKNDPYFQALLSHIHPEITKTSTKHTEENEVIKEREQSDEGLDTKESSNKTIILGRPFLATIHMEIDVFTREVSLGIKEDKIKIKMNKQDCNFTTSISENLSNKHLDQRSTSQEIQADIYDTDLNESCIHDNQLQDELKYGAYNTIGKTHWCEPDSKLGGRTWEKTIMEDREDLEKCRETMTRAIIRTMVKQIPKEWFSGVSEDKDYLEGIIDYLEPTLYDGFIDLDDEAYKQRRNKLLGMPYINPHQI